MEYAVEIKNVTKRFKETVAVNNVTVGFEKGKIHGIIGRNGSGKTVLFKCICGLFPVTEGEITVLGQKIGDGKRVPKDVGAIISAQLLRLSESAVSHGAVRQGGQGEDPEHHRPGGT